MQDQNFDKDKFDINKFVRILLRGRFFISIFTFFFTSALIGYSYTIKNTWQGSFQIIVEKKNQNSFSNNFASLGIEALTGFSGVGLNQNKTQEFILRSPSVLFPVYQFYKKEKLKEGVEIDISYKKWLEDFLTIEFQKGTSVLDVKFRDFDKQFIIKTLDLISAKYQDYSRKERKKNINNALKFTEIQVSKSREKFNKSLKKLNKFSIENGLGDIDGFVDLGNKEITAGGISTSSNLQSDALTKVLPKNIQSFLDKSNNDKAGQRYEMQFKLLEQYEAQYVTLKSKLKDNSKIMITLKNKIDNLKANLKRPNEILLEFKNLKRIAARDEYFLNKTENTYNSILLEKIKQQDPWELIYKPTIDDAKVSPSRRDFAILSFLAGLIFSSSCIVIREKRIGLIYEKEDLFDNIEFEYLETLYEDREEINVQIIKSILLEKDIPLKNSQIGFISCTENSFINQSSKEFSIFKKDSFNQCIINTKEDLEKVGFIFLLIKPGCLKNENILFLNKYLKLYKNKILGWLFIDSNTKFIK